MKPRVERVTVVMPCCGGRVWKVGVIESMFYSHRLAKVCPLCNSRNRLHVSPESHEKLVEAVKFEEAERAPA